MKPTNPVSEKNNTQHRPPVLYLKRASGEPYHWLRVPAVMIAMIGAAGILLEKVGMFSGMSTYIKTPPFMTSCMMVGAAVVLYGISRIRYHAQKRNDSLDTIGTPIRHRSHSD